MLKCEYFYIYNKNHDFSGMLGKGKYVVIVYPVFHMDSLPTNSKEWECWNQYFIILKRDIQPNTSGYILEAHSVKK